MQGKAWAVTLVAAVLASCADTPSRQAATPAAREKVAATVIAAPRQANAEDLRAGEPRRTEVTQAKANSAPKRAERKPDGLVFVTVTTTWSEVPSRVADKGGSTALPVRRPSQGEGVFAAPLAVSGLEDPTVF